LDGGEGQRLNETTDHEPLPLNVASFGVSSLILSTNDVINSFSAISAPTVASSSSFGTTCEKCGEMLIAPEWSEYVSERLVINL
jgi:hypothetical protein